MEISREPVLWIRSASRARGGSLPSGFGVSSRPEPGALPRHGAWCAIYEEQPRGRAGAAGADVGLGVRTSSVINRTALASTPPTAAAAKAERSTRQ
jgi:hypothetical protein